MSALSSEMDVDVYKPQNLLEPFTLDLSVAKGTYTLVQATQKRGDVVFELLIDQGSGYQIVARADFPTEYPFDEIILVSKSQCSKGCALQVKAKNKIDQAFPLQVKVQTIDAESEAVPYLRALSQTAHLTHEFESFTEPKSKAVFANVIETLHSALDQGGTNDSRNYRSLIHMRLAESYDLLNNPVGRKDSLQKLQEAWTSQESIYQAYSNYELGAIAETQSREIQLYQSGMEFSEKLGEPLVWAIGANYLATALISSGEFEEAKALLKEAEEVFKEQGSIFWMSYPLNNLSWANYRSGRFDAALKYAAQLKFIADSYQDTENEFWSLYNLGFIYQQKGDLAIAQEFIDESLDGIRSLKTRKAYKSLDALNALLLRQKSILLRDQGAFEQALDTVEELKQTVLEQNQVRRLPEVLFLEAEIYFELGQIQLAEKSLHEAIEISKDSEREIFLAKCYRKMAEIKLQGSETVSGLNYLTDAINLLSTTGDHVALTRLLIYTLEGLSSAGGVEQAAELLPKIDTLVKKNGVGLDRIEYGYRKAAILSETGNFAQARLILTSALGEVDLLLSKVKRKDLRRSYFSLQKNLYESLIELTIRNSPNDAQKSLEIAEEFKGLTLEEDLLKLSRNSRVRGDYLERRNYLHKQLLSASKALLSNNSELIIKEARVLSSELEALEAKVEWGEASTIERSHKTNIDPLSSEVIVLYYFLGQNKSWCWVLNESSIDVVELPNEKTILALSEPVVSTYSIPPSARSGSSGWEDRQALVKLSDTLLQGALSTLASRGKSFENLVIVRDGVLSNVPYAQLVSPETEKYLIEDYAVSYVASINSWQQLKKRAKNVPKTDKFGLVSSSVAYESGNLRLPELPNADLEITKIVSLFGSNARAISDDYQDIALDEFLSEPVDILHFATHVSLNADSPYLSFLLLPQKGSNERLWLSTQISSRRIPANTVVLSGCESSSGKLDAGEGMLSISRAFIEAGATSVIGSTRKIQDDSSALLMGYMYEQLKYKTPLARSLQKAQTKFLSQHPEYMDPYFWSGYQLMGAG